MMKKRMHGDLERFMLIPYRDGGRDWNGVDCYGLVYLWFKEVLGIELFDYKYDGETAHTSMILKNMHKDWLEIEKDERSANDGVVICNGSDEPNHIGLVQPGGDILHALDGVGVCTGKWHIWRGRVYAVARYRGVNANPLH